jgi:TldD protein
MLKDVFTNRGLSLPGRPTELRAQQNTNQMVQLMSGNLLANNKTVTRGISARVFDKGVYGFASAPAMDGESVSRVLKTAAENAAFLGSHADKKLTELPLLLAGDEAPRNQEKKIPQKLLLEFSRELDSYITGKYPKLAGRSVTTNCLCMEKFLFASNGGETPVMKSHSLLPRATVMIGLTVKDSKGAPVALNQAEADFAHFTDTFKSPTDLFGLVDELYERVIKKSEGVYCNAGRNQVVMGPDITGMLAHEAIGHTVEADSVLGGSISSR